MDNIMPYDITSAECSNETIMEKQQNLAIPLLVLPEQQSNVSNNASKTSTTAALASDIALLLEINPDKSTNIVNKSIEMDLLTRLDELHGMLDMIKSDNFALVNEFLPNMHAKMKELRPIFDQIDRLEVFVNTIRKNIAVIEKDLNDADNYSSFKIFKRAFSGMSLFSTKKETLTGTYNPPAVFRTSDFVKTKGECN